MPASIADAIWRGRRHQLPPSFPRSPGIIPVVLAAFISVRRAATVLSRNERNSADRRAEMKAFFSTTSSPAAVVNNLGATWLTGYSPRRGRRGDVEI